MIVNDVGFTGVTGSVSGAVCGAAGEFTDTASPSSNGALGAPARASCFLRDREREREREERGRERRERREEREVRQGETQVRERWKRRDRPRHRETEKEEEA